jgi:hypothetical protein
MSAILAAPIAMCAAIACPQAAATVAVAQATSAHAAAAPTAHGRPAQRRAANRAAAVSAAMALVVRTPAPAGARRLTAEPIGDGRLLAHALAFTTGTRAWPSLLRGARFLHEVDTLIHTKFATATPIPGG